jgi:hypothetical protein
VGKIKIKCMTKKRCCFKGRKDEKIKTGSLQGMGENEEKKEEREMSG